MTMGTQVAADVITTQAMVVMQDRPVVGLSPLLAEVLRTSGESGRRLQIVTSSASRLTLPLRLSLTPANGASWVVRDGGGYYDGLTGQPMRWTGEGFAGVPDARNYAPGYTTRPTERIGAQLTLTFRVNVTPGEMVGGVVEQLSRTLTEHSPAGWGTAEPATHPWLREALTAFVRDQGGRPTWMTFVGSPSAPGGPVLGTMLVTPAPGGPAGGVQETVTMAVGYPAGAHPPVTDLPALVGALAGSSGSSGSALGHGRLVSLLGQLTPGRPDLTVEPRWVGSTGPIGLAVAGAAPAELRGQPIGTAGSAMTWFALGDGRSQDGWQRYSELMKRLNAR